MADDNPDNVLSATFPAPPPFWKHFTPDNRTRFRELQQQYAADHPAEDASASDALPPRIPDVPPELRYLQPPEPPANGKYRSFGDAYDINTALTSLRSMGVEQLYPSPPSSPSPEQRAGDGGSNRQQQQVIHSQWTLDRASYIKKMTQSLMLNYLEMLGVLSVDPARWQEKYEHMQTLLFNAHHLINEYRPHQARASLITMLEEQLAKRREEVEGVRRMREKIEGVLAGLANQGVDGVGDAAAEAREKGAAVGGVEAEEERRKREQRAVMKALDDELMAD
ncbi:RNA polymerase ii mediator complex protein [Lasiodiplodia theobromae]|uniref:RNA polymerase ii mediator complex protein n=1 Tax=Lasiodiplodia theobromae TaxID=45133 RepID=UPI0015C3A0D6|nr:RNA polymerase ii mediator complex protein [Lasiodiplodia theobromae]KAF4543183.1 RNA polymerase ii mediator complex protein [Lasiodiplodia theobromae]